MQRSITFRQYRGMDIGFFTALLCLCETLITLGATRWFPQEPYTLSLTAAVTAIVMARWGGFAIMPLVAGTLVFCLVSSAAAAQYAIYLIGSLPALLWVPALKRLGGWQRLQQSVLMAMFYGFSTALFMQLGRFAIALILGNAPGVCLGFITTDVLSTLFAVLLVWIARRLDGMLEDQRHYLLRVQEEKERQQQAADAG